MRAYFHYYLDQMTVFPGNIIKYGVTGYQTLKNPITSFVSYNAVFDAKKGNIGGYNAYFWNVNNVFSVSYLGQTPLCYYNMVGTVRNYYS